MRKIFLLLLLISPFSFIKAQTFFKYDYDKVESELCCKECRDGKPLVFDFCEVMPQYDGDMEKELNQAIEIDKKLKANVGILFIVNCEGKANDYVNFYGKNEELTNQVIDFLKENDRWSSAKQAGKAVDCKQRLYLRIKRGKIKLQ